MTFLTRNDFDALRGVDLRLALTVIRAAKLVSLAEKGWVFRVTSGLRTREEQIEHVGSGASHTLDSKHLHGLAVDLAILAPDRSAAFWEFWLYRELADIMSTAHREVAAEHGFTPSLFWGGNWPKLRDGPHFELR